MHAFFKLAQKTSDQLSWSKNINDIYTLQEEIIFFIAKNAFSGMGSLIKIFIQGNNKPSTGALLQFKNNINT